MKQQHSDTWLLKNRRLWATAHEIGLDESELRDVVESVVGARSISGLSELQQAVVVQALSRLKKDAHAKRRRQKKRIDAKKGDGITTRQLLEVWRLSEALGWGRPALRVWLKRCFGAQREEWLSANKASCAIQGLKAQIERKRKK